MHKWALQKKTLPLLFWTLLLVLFTVLSGCGGQAKNQEGHTNAAQEGGMDSAQEGKQEGSEGSSQAEAAANGQEPAIIQKIRKRGYLLAGCKTDVPGLSMYDGKADAWAGLEIELAYQTAAELFGVSIDEAKQQGLVQFVGVTVADREEKLEQQEVDCLFATYTITKERQEKFAFSNSYYTDYIGMMVKSSGEDANSLGTSDIRSIADLDGKKIGVAKNATTRKMFLDYMDTMNNLKTAPMFFEYKSYEALFQALLEGSIDVMAVDVSILNGYVDHTTKILNDRFGGQRYGAAVRKEDVALLDYINAALGQ
ncbi:MAG: transporter substrate-binding domain-containing protein [Eubacterium sp.]|nr:transporter substrate-binding domain-containing protein [Eubacterium sp.]